MSSASLRQSIVAVALLSLVGEKTSSLEFSQQGLPMQAGMGITVSLSWQIVLVNGPHQDKACA